MLALIKKHHKPLLGTLLLLPAVATILFSTILPALSNVVLSFMKWNGFSEATWTGIANYVKIFTDRVSRQSFTNTLVIAFGITVLSMLLGTLFALLIIRMRRLEGAFYRLVLFIPVMLPMTVVGLLFTLMYNYDMGLVNSFLRLIGLGSLARPWLADPGTVLWAIAIPGAWKQIGLIMMMVYTAICAIPAELYDACEIDGCGQVRRIWMVTLPLIRSTLWTSLLLTITFSFKTYDLVWIMTKGGPGNLSYIVPIQMLDYGFKFNNFGAAAASGTAFTVLVVALVAIVRVIDRSEAYEY